MNKLGQIIAGWVLVGMAVSASAAFVAPTDAQLAAAAAAPKNELAALLKHSGADQAAGVVASVAEKVLGLGLSAENEAQRLNELIATLFNVMPRDQHSALAAALGRALPGSPALAGNPAAVAAIRDAIASAGGADAPALLAAFDQPFQLGVDAPPPVLHPPPPDVEPEEDSTPTPTPTPTPAPEPPIADLYEGQTL